MRRSLWTFTGLLAATVLAGCTSEPGVSPDAAPGASPAHLLLSPGYVGTWTQESLISGVVIAEWIGPAPRDLAGAGELTVAWRQWNPAVVGWAEIALATGTPSLGDQPLTVVATGDATDEVNMTGTVRQDIVVRPGPPVARGTELWLLFATESPTGFASPHVVVSGTLDPIGAGTVASLRIPGWRPSLQIGSEAMFAAQAQGDPPPYLIHPVTAAVLIP